LLRSDDIVDFKDHFNNLGGKLKLVLLGEDRLEDSLFHHVGSSPEHSINTEVCVFLFNLGLSNRGNILNWVVTGVLSKSQWNFFQSISEGSYSVLFDTLDFISGISNSDGASELSGTTSTDNVGVLNHVTYNANSVMKASAGFVTNSLRSTTDHDCDSL
jgi:hypothetical protein